jgi:peptide/nickel transport system permease protein
MLKFIVRRFFLLLLTMLLVSVAVFLITESSPGNVARNVLGAFVTPEQEASFLAQMGLNKPVYTRYLYWLLGSDWSASRKVGLPLKRMTTAEGFDEWWAVREDGALLRWRLEGENLIALAFLPSIGASVEYINNDRWLTDEDGASSFWGIDDQNHAVLWEKGTDRKVWTFVIGTGWMETSGGPVDYTPLKKGFIRGDPGVSFRTGRNVNKSIFIRLRNSLFLAGGAFIIVMPLALFLGLLAGLKEGSLRDRALSIGGMMFTVT